MDSSRSGLLSTLLMTLPLIVVPAVALLRPPGQAGISTAPLDASEDDEFDSMFDEFDGFDADPSGAFKKEQAESGDADRGSGRDSKLTSTVEDDIFNEIDPRDADTRESFTPRSAASRTSQSDPFMDAAPSNAGTTAKPRKSETPSDFASDTNPEKPDSKQIVEQLNSMGALKTIWFAAGDKKPVGLAVFFRGETDLTRIRFESVGLNRNECAEDVLEQVQRWHQQNPQQSQ